MPFLELSLRVRAEDEHRAENALMDLGALSVTLMDADAATPNEKAVLEPGVGETPLWPEITLLALFPGDTVAELVLHALESFDDAIDLSQADFREVADQDWERAWMDQYVPLQFGRRTWIVPWNMDPPPEAKDGVIVRLDPGLAFGSGTHPTTALCLQWLDSLVLREKTVLDFGCGSGILALAALKLGAAGAVGAASFAWPFIDQMRPDASTLALASIEVDVSALEPGMSLTVKWRGKPVFIRRRTPQEIEAARAVQLTELVDSKGENANKPDADASDANRTLDEAGEWLVMLGVCTHLGCVPLGDGAGDFGGWFCPCHGSHYDTSGRIRKGPAPRNLPVPVAAFENETTIKLG